MSEKNNNEAKASKSAQTWTLALPASALAILAGLMLQVSNEAAIALQLAGQHGETILLMRQEIDLMRSEIKDDNVNRYTNKDAERDLGYIRRDITELKQVIREAHSVH